MMVKLCPQEGYMSAMVGLRRQLEALRAGFTDRNGAGQLDPARAFFAHINGAQGECAAARALGAYWPMTINAAKALPDLLPDWQVRTRVKHEHDLIVRDDDADEQRFVLVTGTFPDFVVHGWILGRDAKRPEWREDRGERSAPCYWVPQDALHPLELMTQKINE